MKICYIIGRFPPVYGGATNVEILKSKYLIEKGHDIYFITPRFDKEHPKFEVFEGINVIRVYPALKGPVSELLYVLNAFLQLIFLRIKPDLLVDVIPFGNSMLITRLFSIILRLPIVARLTQSGSNEPLSALKGKFSFIKKRLFSTYKKIIAISPDLYKNCLQAGISKDRVKLIPNCVDTERFLPLEEDEKIELRNKLFPGLMGGIVTVVGAVSERKRAHLAVEVWRVLKSKYDRPVTLVFVGPVESSGHPFDVDYVDQLKQTINNYRLSDSIIFTGLKENVQAYFQVSDILLFLSKREGLPGVVLQSMSSGIPIITTKMENITEFILTNGHEGIISSDEPKEIADHIITLLSNAELRQAMGIKGRQNALNRFSIPEVSRKIEHLYFHVSS